MARGLAGLLVTLVVLLVLGVLVDAQLTRSTEERIAAAVASNLGAGETTVDLQGWPVIPRLLFDRVPAAVLVARDVPVPDRPIRLRRLDVTLTQVRLSAAALREGAATPVEAASGRFRAELDGAALLAAAQLPEGVEAIEPVGGVIRLRVLGGVSIDAQVRAQAGAIVVSAELPVIGLQEVTVPLEGLPFGATVEGARVEGDALVLEGTVGELVIAP